MPGPTELALILVIVLIVFGAGKLPQVFEAFGLGLKKFREAQLEEPEDITPARAHREIPESPAVSEAEEIGAKTAQHS
jgi:sec-independent protein translocase protein TatA